jgi:hypothetical protein
MTNDLVNDRVFGLVLTAIFVTALILNAVSY